MFYLTKYNSPGALASSCVRTFGVPLYANKNYLRIIYFYEMSFGVDGENISSLYGEFFSRFFVDNNIVYHTYVQY